MRLLQSAFPVLSAVLLSAGCGNTVVVTGTGGSGTSGSTASTASGKTTAVGTGTTTTSSGNTCSIYDDRKGSGSMVVRFENQSGLPIYLPMSCGQILFDLKELGSMDAPPFVFDHSCLQTCHDLQTQTPIACGACAPSSFLLQPGQTHDVTWDGTGLKSGVMMPSSCYLMPEPSCSEIVAAPSGTYEVLATGYASCGANCTCDASGICQGTAGGEQATSNSAQATFPSQNLVQVVFGPCAFPCPNG